MKPYRGIVKKLLASLLALTMLTPSAPVLAKTQYDRAAGSDRYSTSISISQKGWKASEYAIIATGENFPDALGAAPLARKYNAPVLLTEKDVLRPDLETEISRLGVKEIFILGGIGVISENIENMFIQKGIKVTRLAGQDRYGTSIKIAGQLGSFDTIIAADGDNFADALSISPIAASMGIPIILTNKDNIPPVVKSFISGRNITKTYVIGGTDIISENSAREFPNIERILGWDKYERNLNIIKRFQDSINFSNLYIATGADFPDSLSGSALASITSSPITLMDKNDVIGITDLIKEKSINNVVVLGGEGVVSGAMIDKIQNGPLFKPNDILAFYPPDWNDLAVAKKAHASVVGSPHQEVSGTPNQPQYPEIIHKEGMKHAAHISTAFDFYFEEMGHKEVMEDITGNKINNCSIHYPGVKEGITGYVKHMVDIGADILCIDNVFLNYSTQSGDSGGDFSEYSMENFNTYLINKYGIEGLKDKGIKDIGTFNFKDFIKNGYMKQYTNFQKDDIPFYRDYMEFQFYSCLKFWSDIINEGRAYAKSKGRDVYFTTNGNWNAEDAAAPMLDAYTNEYRFDYPSLDNIIPYTKVYRGLGEQIALLVNFGYFSREIITRPDLSELMKIYTAEAYNAGGYLYVPYGMVCDDGKGGWDAFSADMDKLYPYYDFIHNNGVYYEGLKSQAKIGVFYSYACIKNNRDAMDSSFYGISNMLVDTHHQYEVIYAGDGAWMEDSITPEDFSRFNVVVLPNIECISDRDLSMVLDYVRDGGNVICFGNFAIKDENENPVKRNELSQLLKQGNHRYGLGQFVYVSDNLGDNYNSTQDKQSKDRMENMLSSFIKDDVKIDAGRNIEIMPYWSSKNKAEIIHLINRNYNPVAQKINSPGNINISFNLNPELLGRELKVTFDSPDGNGPVELEYRTDGNTLSVTVPNLVTYGVVYIGGKDQG